MENGTSCEKLKFTWRIENFKFCNFENDEVLVSPIFKANNISSSEWCLKLFPRVLTSNKKVFRTCQLQNVELADELIFVDFEIKMFNDSGLVLENWKEEKQAFRKNRASKKLNSIERNESDEMLGLTDLLTVICCIQQRKVGEAIITSCEGRTIVEIEKSMFEWDVAYYDPRGFSEKKEFDRFDTGTLGIMLTYTDESNIFITFFSVQSNQNTSRFIACKITLLDIYGSKRNRITESENNCEESRFVEAKLVMPENFELKFPMPEIKSKTTENKIGKIIFLFDISISTGKHIDRGLKYKHEDYFEYPLKGVTIDSSIREFFLDQEPKIELLTIDGMTCAVHKSLLVSMSRYFDAQLNGPSIENELRITITELDAETLPIFVDFLYTHVLKTVDYKIAKKLVFAAVRYGIDLLKHKCLDLLLADKSTVNTLDLIFITDLVRYDHTKKSAIDKINRHSGKILFSEQFCQLFNENVPLGIKILKKWGMKF